MTTALLKTAVYQNRVASKRGLSERLFAVWFHRLVYNQIWEDPRVDLEALKLEPTSRVLTIASGGCNVLNYLLADPAEIVAVDLNPAHLALTRLKLTAVQHLPDHGAFYRLFGRGIDPGAWDTYRDHLQPHLDDEARALKAARRWASAVSASSPTAVSIAEGCSDASSVSCISRRGSLAMTPRAC